MNDNETLSLIRILQSDVRQLRDPKVMEREKRDIVEWMVEDLEGVIRVLKG